MELRLRPIADHSHGSSRFGGQIFGGDRRRCRCAQGRQKRHFGQKDRIASFDIGQQAKGGDGLQSAAGIFGVAVYVFEPVGGFVCGWHQLDHALGRMTGNARGFIKALPPFEIVFNGAGQPSEHLLQANMIYQLHHVID